MSASASSQGSDLEDPPKGSTVAIRPMTHEDLETVLEVERLCYTSPWPEEIFLRELKNTWSHVDLLVTGCHEPGSPGEDILGHLGYWVVHDELHVLNVAVHPRFRGQGLGVRLMERALEVCRCNRLGLITLEVRAGNQPAIGLYRKFGLEQVGIRRRYYVDNREDALLMSLNLEVPQPQGPDGLEADLTGEAVAGPKASEI